MGRAELHGAHAHARRGVTLVTFRGAEPAPAPIRRPRSWPDFCVTFGGFPPFQARGGQSGVTGRTACARPGHRKNPILGAAFITGEERFLIRSA